MLKRKIIRTLLNYKAQMISMLLMIILGVGIFLGCNIEWYSIKTNRTNYYEDTGYPEYRIYKDSFSLDELQYVKDFSDVKYATRALTTLGSLNNNTYLMLNVLEDCQNIKPLYIDGEVYSNEADGIYLEADGIYLSDLYAKENNIKLNDYLDIEAEGFKIHEPVKGLIKSSEYLICLKDSSQLLPNYKEYAYCYLSPKMITKYLGQAFYNTVYASSKLSTSDFEAKALNALGASITVLSYQDETGYSGSNGEIEEGKTMALLIPTAFILIAVLTMVTTMARISTNERIQMGVLKSLGFKRKKIARHYSLYGLIIGIIGTLIGCVLAYGIAYYIINPKGPMSTYLDFPSWHLYMPWYGVLIVILLPITLGIISYLIVNSELKGTACETLKPKREKAVKASYIEKTKFFSKASFQTKWNIRDMLRHKARTIMSIIGVLFSTVLIFACMGMRDTVIDFKNTLYNENYNFENKLTLNSQISNTKALDLASKYEADYEANVAIKLNNKTVVLSIINNSRNLLGIVDEKENRLELKDGGVYVCRRIKDDGYKINKEIDFNLYGSKEIISSKVIGVCLSMTEGIYMTENTANELGISYKIQTLYTNLNAMVDSNVSSITTKTELLSTFNTMMEMMDSMIWILILASAILAVVVLYNLASLGYIEKIREMSTLKVIGFTNKKIAKILVVGTIWITVMGLIIGLPLGAYLLDILLRALAGEYEMNMAFGYLSYIVGIVVPFLVSLVTIYLISKKTKKLDMVSALKEREA